MITQLEFLAIMSIVYGAAALVVVHSMVDVWW